MTTDLFSTGYRAASRLLALAATSDETRVLVEFVDARLNRRLGGLFFLLCHFF